MKKIIFYLQPFLFFSLLFLFLHDSSHATYLIKLKNSRTFTVHDYRDAGDKIIFSSHGGEITINKDSIKEITEAEDKIIKQPVPEGEEKIIEEIEETAQPKEDKSKDGLEKLRDEVNEFNKQRETLEKEREDLMKKREDLLNEIKRIGRLVMPTKEKRLKKQAAELEEEIKGFNEKIETLMEKQEALKNEIKTLETEAQPPSD